MSDRDTRATRATRWLVWTAAACITVSLLVMIGVAAAGPSITVPTMAHAPHGAPPWWVSLHPSRPWVLFTMWATALVAAAGVGAGLLAVYRGARFPVRPLLVVSFIVIAAFVFLPAAGTTDTQSYAIDGNMAVMHYSPYVYTPAQMVRLGDKMAVGSPPTWQLSLSDYGPVATAEEYLSAKLGGASMALITFWLKVWIGLAYGAVALLLDRLLRGDRAMRLRAHLLWSLNPLLLWEIVASGHIDGLSIAFGLGGLVTLRLTKSGGQPALVRCVAAGALLGVAAATKSPYALFLVGGLWAVRRSPARIACVLAGWAAFVGVVYAIAGNPAVHVLFQRGNQITWDNLYQVFYRPFGLAGPLGADLVPGWVFPVAVAAFVIVALALLFRLPDRVPEMPAVAPALALSMAWIFFWPFERPWYDVMIIALLALYPSSYLDIAVLVRLCFAAITYMEAVNVSHKLWFQQVQFFEGEWITSSVRLLTALALIWMCATGRWGSRPGQQPAGVSQPVLQPLRLTGLSRSPHRSVSMSMGRDTGRLRAYRVTELPRHTDPHSGGSREREAADPGRAQRTAALTAAYHAGIAGSAGQSGAASGLVAFGWVRTAPGQPVRLLVAGDALTGSSHAPGGEHREVLLSLPSGARGTALEPGELDSLIAPLACWREVAGISDGLRCAATGNAGGQCGDEAGRNGPAGLLSFEDALLGSWTGPFGWMVIAEPVPAARLRALAAECGLRRRLAEGAADRFPERATLARRLTERHAELERGISSGLWRISIAAGGTDEASAARVAGLLCATADLGGLPYTLSPGPTAPAPPLTTVDGAWSAEPGGDAAAAAPFYGSTEVLASLTRPPQSEVPGVRLTLRPEFDVTPETGPGAGIRLGAVLDRNLAPAGPFTVPAESLNRHVFVCGATGAGKSQTVRSLLEAATASGIPWLVIEPAKAEYRLMAGRLPGTEVIRIRPGEPDAIAAGLNPLEPAAGDGGRFPLQTHADLVRALFIASFQAEEPFPQVLSAALGRVYEEAGWDLALGEPVRPGAAGDEPGFPTLTDLQRVAERVVSEIGYSQRVTDDVLGFIRVRLASLRHGTTGRFLEGGHPLDFAVLLRKNVVLEIEDVGDDGDKAFLMGAVLIRLVEYLRLTRQPVSGLRHLTVIEEAHRLLRRSDAGGPAGRAAGHAVEMFAGLLAEIRAYGEGLVIAEQIPARLSPDAIKNTAVKLVHRLPAADDRDAVGATMNASPAQARYLVTLPPGRAAVFSDGMDFPVLVQINDGTERERAARIPASDARSVVSPRSASCGAQCTVRPCTLRDLRTARRTLDAMPWVRSWAELSVLGHLTGWPAPVPKPDVLAPFAALPARLTQCALSHAVEAALDGDAVAAARAAISRPTALCVHVTAALTARTERGEWLCALDEPEWLLPGLAADMAAFGPAVLGSFIGGDWLGPDTTPPA